MNLIEEYGSYEDARYGLRVLESSAYEEDQAYANKLKNKMLEYRRQHNIYEVGDWFVSDTILKPFKIVEKDEDYLKLWCKEHTAEFSGNAEKITKILKNARHATDTEIKSGKRRPELDSDTCSDIRNHILPLTKVIER